MNARWLSRKEYEALEAESQAPETIAINEHLRGRVLESHATPHTLEQKDLQDHQLIHDLLVQKQLHETHSADTYVYYAPTVNSEITESATTTNFTYQAKKYLESCDHKIETIEAQHCNYMLQSDVYIQQQHTLHLNAPHEYKMHASTSITRVINERNVCVDQHTLKGENFTANYKKITRQSDVTLMQVDGLLQLQLQQFKM
jgi:hypothetical protein